MSNKLSTKYVRDILETMYPYRSEMVPCLIGPPGIGKTQSLYQFAQDMNVNVVTFILSNTIPSEVSGIRMPDKDTKKMEVFDDMRMASLKDGDILFFDEILEAPPMLWAACLTLIQDRIMASGRKLPDVFIVAASNQVVSPSIIPASTRDRFQFVELEFDFPSWQQWMKDEHGFKVPNGFQSLIKADSDQYNILTPRRATKLLTWLKGMRDDDEGRIAACRIIDCMFDNITRARLCEIAFAIPDAKEQIKSAILDGLSDQFQAQFICDALDGVPVNKLLETLQAMDMWPEIEAALAGSVYNKVEP